MKTIAICGSTCVGKTTLINRLILNYKDAFVVQEKAEDNIFFKKCFDMSEGTAFKGQLMFYIEYLNNILSSLKDKYSFIFFDRFIEEHLLLSKFRYSIGELTKEEFYICEQLAQSIKQISPKIHKIIYLYCSLETVILRKQNRNKIWDKDINHEYLKKLNETYNEWFSNLYTTYDSNNVLCLNTDSQININEVIKFINQ